MTTELFSEPAEPMSEVEAKEFVDYVREQQDELPRRTIDAYQRRAWLALGYKSWAAMCDGEDLRLPREVTSELRAGGLSIRAIAAATGSSVGQTHADVTGVQSRQGNRTPGTQSVTGIDGKVYSPQPHRYQPTGEEVAAGHKLYGPDAFMAKVDGAPPPPLSEPATKPAPVMLTLRTHTGEEVAYPKPQSKATFNATPSDGISWAEWSWNPVTGCLHGCRYCYARAIIHRYPDANPAGFTPLFHAERLDAPANTVIPQRYRDDEHVSCGHGDCEICAWRRVFVCSMADLYGRWIPDEWITQVHASMLASPQWQYILLTKFPDRYVGLDLPSTAWVGTSVDEQKRVRIAERAFRQIDGVKVKWLSLEPLREPLEFTDLSMFDWVVIGAQTQTNQPDGYMPAFAPPFDWVARIVTQAREAGCRVHLKPNLHSAPGMQWLNEYPES